MAASSIEDLMCLNENRILGPAEILQVDVPGQRVRLRLAGSDDDLGVWAQIAIAAAEIAIHAGDQVLVIGDNPRDLYVIGVLQATRISSHSPARLVSKGGAYATVSRSPEQQTLQVFSARNELLFEYDEVKRHVRINVEYGDLEFVTRNGDIVFSSARDVLIQGASIRVSGERGDVQLENTTISGDHLLAHYKEVRFISDRCEAAFHTLTEKAKNVFRVVEQLAQIKAGRIRTLVDSTYFFKAKKAFVKSDEDYKIRAEKIHLG
jgi:hypothetical protein